MADREGYLSILWEMLSDKEPMRFEEYCKLAVAFGENPKFESLTAVAYYIAVIHQFMYKEPILYESYLRDVEEDIERMLDTCPNCGKPLLDIIDGGKK